MSFRSLALRIFFRSSFSRRMASSLAFRFASSASFRLLSSSSSFCSPFTLAFTLPKTFFNLLTAILTSEDEAPLAFTARILNISLDCMAFKAGTFSICSKSVRSMVAS